MNNTRGWLGVALMTVCFTVWADGGQPLTDDEKFDMLHPAGSVYMSVNDSLPVGFRGRWVKLPDGRSLMSASGDAVGTMGGANSMTLSTANMPAHSHGGGTLTPSVAKFTGIKPNPYANNVFTYPWHWWYATTQSSEGVSYGEYTMNTSGKWTGATSSVGSNKAFDNRPSFLAVSMWKRLPDIARVKALQRYPWNGKVDIQYTVLGDLSNETLKVWAVDSSTGTECEAKTIAYEANPLVDGTHTLTWDMDADGVKWVSSNVVFKITIKK